MEPSFNADGNAHSMRMATLQGSQALKILLALAIAAVAAVCVGQILTAPGDNPLSVLLLVVGIILMFYAVMRPWESLIIFLWLVMTIDAVKRLTYAVSNMSMFDVAEILAVPVLLMGGLYLRVFLLHWFVARREIAKLDLKKFWPILALFTCGLSAILYKQGTSFGTLSNNYQIFCYIPAAVVVPHLLNTPERWKTYCQQINILYAVIGVYGVVQSIHGPFAYEEEYLYSGLTSTISLMEQESFRAFSLLNTSPTYAGMLMICLFYTYYSINLKYGRLTWNLTTIGLAIFSASACFLATQRGALVTGLIVLSALPMFSRPRLLMGVFAAFFVSYGLVIAYATEIKDWLFIVDAQLDPLRTSHFMNQNFGLLTFGMRLDGFAALHSADVWTPLGGKEIEGGHNLLSDLLAWVGYIGTAIFTVIVFTIIYLSTQVLQDLKANRAAYLWAQVNLAVFLYVLVWGAFLGSVIHISPINFFFWSSLGNLVFLYHNKSFEVEEPVAFRRVPLVHARGTRPAAAWIHD